MSDKYDELHPDWLETDGIARICYKLVSIIRDEEGQEIGREEGSAVTITTMAEQFESNLALAQAEAWPGSVTVERVTDDRSLDQIRADKLTELSTACNAAITAGMDVETTQGAEHFSLQETDQINLTTALSAVQAGAPGYPYHADGQLCRMFTAAEIQAVAEASVQHKLYHTTLCNHLMTWARRADTKDELSGITYSADGLPDDLAANMEAVLAAAVGDNNA